MTSEQYGRPIKQNLEILSLIWDDEVLRAGLLVGSIVELDIGVSSMVRRSGELEDSSQAGNLFVFRRVLFP